MVGLNPMWFTAQHVLTLAAGIVALSLNVLKPLYSRDHKMTQVSSADSRFSNGKVFYSACSSMLNQGFLCDFAFPISRDGSVVGDGNGV